MRTLLAVYRDGFPEDGDEFSASFVLRYRHTAVTVCDESGPVAAGYLVPKRLITDGKVQDVCYLDAFSVLTPYRGKGIAETLMSKIIAQARMDGIRFIFLSPFNSRYYHKYGFVDVVSARRETIRGGRQLGLRKASAADVKRVYQAMTAQADVYLVRDARFYADCEADHVLVGDIAVGDIWQGEFEVTACTDYAALLDCEELKGLTCAIPGEGTAWVQLLDVENPGVNSLRGIICIIDKI